jgi:serine/threonine protein kinase
MTSHASIPAADAEAVLALGATLGRYVVLEPLGRGGMGVVYAAYDPALDRRVAVKLLRRASRDEKEQQRLLREGKVMARLSHANVVTVLDVGTIAERLFVAMELVDGQTLRAWCRTPRSWRETVGMYLQAGRGLAAAHAAGIAHRDFKPDNVIVGRDGRARVLDFGLAQDMATLPTVDLAAAASAPAPATDDAARSVMTADGAIIGTPSYMSPEQLEGDAVDERADQFAFCASLWESLYGQLPFEGRDLLALLASVRSAKPRAAPGREVPSWIRAALERGLSEERDARFPSMNALLTALENDPSARRRRTLVIG